MEMEHTVGGSYGDNDKQVLARQERVLSVAELF